MVAVGPRASWCTRANSLSALRMLCAPALAFAIVERHPTAAAALFSVAIATDLADGAVARRYGEASSLGGLIDHTVDAAFCVIGLAALATRDILPWPLPVLVATAFAQYVIDSNSLQLHPLRASRLGRWNGIAYFAAVGVPVVRDALGWEWPSDDLVWWLGVMLAASTAVSMGSRFFGPRRISGRE